MQNTKITCDGCGSDLTTTDNYEDYRIVLNSESIPSEGGVVTLMAIQPDIRRPMHFCGIGCLQRTVAKLG